MSNQFLDTLFDKKDFINVGQDIYETRSQELSDYTPSGQFFSINPLKPFSRRSDDNVGCFRNIMIEFDNIDIKSQRGFLDILPIYPTTVVYSGNKSLHLIWSMSKPFDNREEWKLFSIALANTIDELYGSSIVDRSCLNPSRLSRFPGYKRKNGKVQELMSIGERVDIVKFLTWIRDNIVPLQEERPKNQCSSDMVKYRISGPVYQWIHNHPDDGRKLMLFSAAKELCHNGVDIDTAIDFLEPYSMLEDSVFLHQVRSGYRY